MAHPILDFVPEQGNDYWGTLAIRHEYRNYDRPEIDIIWYPIARVRRDNYERYIGQEVYQYTSGGGVYHLRNGLTQARFTLENGGQTRPCRQETKEIPRPKTRLQVRWTRGRWEKLTSKGWVWTGT